MWSTEALRPKDKGGKRHRPNDRAIERRKRSRKSLHCIAVVLWSFLPLFEGVQGKFTHYYSSHPSVSFPETVTSLVVWQFWIVMRFPHACRESYLVLCVLAEHSEASIRSRGKVRKFGIFSNSERAQEKMGGIESAEGQGQGWGHATNHSLHNNQKSKLH